MREIKFRGRKSNGEWVYGDLVTTETTDGIPTKKEILPFDKVIFDATEEVEEYTIGQFTGLHDKNGKEIYEGDILSQNGYIWGVYFEVGAFFLSKNGKHDPYDYGVERLNPYTASGSIVLTNIYDDPELLNE